MIRLLTDLLPDDPTTSFLFGLLLGASFFLVHAWRVYLGFKRERGWADPRKRE